MLRLTGRHTIVGRFRAILHHVHERFQCVRRRHCGGLRDLLASRRHHIRNRRWRLLLLMLFSGFGQHKQGAEYVRIDGFVAFDFF